MIQSLQKKRLLPIYFITVGEDEKQKIVYIGQTLRGNRFKKGHLATQKLNDPKYDSKLKKVHFAQLWLDYSNEGENLTCPIEWINDENLVTDIVFLLERILMIHFSRNDEELINIAGVKNNPFMDLSWGASGIPSLNNNKEREYESICILDMCGSGFVRDMYEIKSPEIYNILSEWKKEIPDRNE
ncbi:hypothetical protein ACFOZY_04280 [Chungangia koreensis]|uniref:GIY-YIG domain-containing protein n=1 Tax=Chungangia koreensis TaxID=752657 RepID=A0ABV8X136_9LACT